MFYFALDPGDCRTIDSLPIPQHTVRGLIMWEKRNCLANHLKLAPLITVNFLIQLYMQLAVVFTICFSLWLREWRGYIVSTPQLFIPSLANKQDKQQRMRRELIEQKHNLNKDTIPNHRIFYPGNHCLPLAGNTISFA